MKSLKKVAPIMATGLVVAGFGTVDAFAADTVDTPAPPAPPAEVEKQAAPAPSTEIKSVTPTSTETAPDGETKTQGAVNLSVNDGGDVTSDGSVTLTTIPDGNVPKSAAPTSEEAGDVTIENTDTTTTTDSDTTIGDIDEIKPTEPGNDITTTTPNPDGSTTTEIEGGVTAPGTPSNADKDEVENNISDIVDKSKNENGSYDWDVIETEIKNKYDDAKVESSEGTHTITFTQQSESTDAKLTDSELSIILGGVSLTKTGENTYTYTDKDGKTVTVTVTDDSSTETTTTKWTVTVTEIEGDQTITGSEKVDDSIITDESGESSGSLNVWDILGKIDTDNNKFGNEAAEVTIDKDTGNVTKVEVGNVTYDIKYSVINDNINTSVDLSNMTIAGIYDLLFKGKEGFKLENDTIFKGGSEVTINYENSTVTATYYEITVTKTTTGTTDDHEQVENTVKDDATKAAIRDALKNLASEEELASIDAVVNSAIDNKDGTWTVLYNGQNYTVAVEVKIQDDAPPLSGGTISGDATATIEVEVKVDLDNENGSNLNGLNITEDDVENSIVGEKFGSTGEIITATDKSGNQITITTTKTDGNVTTIKTYIFTIKTETTMDPSGKADKYEDGKLDVQWDENKNLWSFDRNGANAFVVKQADGAVIWYDADVYTTQADLNKLFECFTKADGSLKNQNGNKQIVWVASDDPLVSDGEFRLSDIYTGNGGSLNAIVKITADQILVISNDGKNRLSHFVMGPGSITTTEVTDWSTSGTKAETTEYAGKGHAEGSVTVTSGNDTVVEGSASGVQYGGKLDYSYTTTQPGIEITVSGETETHRDIDVTLNSTPTTPITPPGGGGGTPTTPPGGGGGTTTPTPPPVVDIPEEEPPLVDIPEEEPPLVDIPEEEPPLVDIPEEEPPLVDIPEEQPPLVDLPNTQPPKVTIPPEKVPLVKAPDPSTIEILEEEVPLADVPNTGDTPMGLLAAAAACLSTLGLGILKKRED